MRDRPIQFSDILITWEDNVRGPFDRRLASDALLASIVKRGLDCPLKVEMRDGRLHLLDGYRRSAAIAEGIAAGKLPPSFAVPVVVVHPKDDADRLAHRLLPNVGRQDMTPWAVSKAVGAYRDFFFQRVTHDEIGAALALSPSVVSRALEVQDGPGMSDEKVREACARLADSLSWEDLRILAYHPATRPGDVADVAVLHRWPDAWEKGGLLGPRRSSVAQRVASWLATAHVSPGDAAKLAKIFGYDSLDRFLRRA